MTSLSTHDQVRDLRGALARAHVMIAGGDVVDLSGLDNEIARLINAALAAPACDHPTLRVGLQSLLDEVDSLGTELQRQHDAHAALLAKNAYTARKTV
jgi:hypothetical protein